MAVALAGWMGTDGENMEKSGWETDISKSAVFLSVFR